MSRGYTLEAGGSLRDGEFLRARGSDRDAVGDVLDAGSLSVAIELVDQALLDASLPRSAYIALLSDLYRGVRMRMPYRELMDFARATALRAARGAGVHDGTATPASAPR